MRVVFITDIHGAAEEVKILNRQIEEEDVLLIGGDITHFGHQAEAGKVLEPFLQRRGQTYAVPGNCDNIDILYYLEKIGFSLHGRGAHLGEHFLIGLGGSLPAPVETPFTLFEEEITDILEEALKGRKVGEKLLLLSHQPPHKTKADRVMGFHHVGSRSLWNFIQEQTPLVCLCGHIHESRTKETIGKTKIVNPGPLKNGNYAVLKLNEREIRVELKKL